VFDFVEDNGGGHRGADRPATIHEIIPVVLYSIRNLSGSGWFGRTRLFKHALDAWYDMLHHSQQQSTLTLYILLFTRLTNMRIHAAVLSALVASAMAKLK
jgi:hypothetical protein